MKHVRSCTIHCLKANILIMVLNERMNRSSCLWERSQNVRHTSIYEHHDMYQYILKSLLVSIRHTNMQWFCESGLRTYQWRLSKSALRTYDMYDILIHTEIAMDSAEEQNAAMVLVCQRLWEQPCWSVRAVLLNSVRAVLLNSNCSVRGVLLAS